MTYKDPLDVIIWICQQLHCTMSKCISLSLQTLTFVVFLKSHTLCIFHSYFELLSYIINFQQRLAFGDAQCYTCRTAQQMFDHSLCQPHQQRQ